MIIKCRFLIVNSTLTRILDILRGIGSQNRFRRFIRKGLNDARIDGCFSDLADTLNKFSVFIHFCVPLSQNPNLVPKDFNSPALFKYCAKNGRGITEDARCSNNSLPYSRKI